ncbi:hypothetical protein AGR7A_Lc120263 [Agrobacterium deltaense NCPPB 1641]|uniref:Uncharacterized protein n=1 Tax=Agrobacterium deltaense NCPPB 1641 TaxID=1183425 RepID=A0A1S7TWW1_9HYPH|nr:hypothetical protein AGR7A_Lc120263 [Agrobacterium deltaense NCPPB 1641]
MRACAHLGRPLTESNTGYLLGFLVGRLASALSLLLRHCSSPQIYLSLLVHGPKRVSY